MKIPHYGLYYFRMYYVEVGGCLVGKIGERLDWVYNTKVSSVSLLSNGYKTCYHPINLHHHILYFILSFSRETIEILTIYFLCIYIYKFYSDSSSDIYILYYILYLFSLMRDVHRVYDAFYQPYDTIYIYK